MIKYTNKSTNSLVKWDDSIIALIKDEHEFCNCKKEVMNNLEVMFIYTCKKEVGLSSLEIPVDFKVLSNPDV